MIFYFTGTGNSLYVAEKLRDELDDTLVSIASMKKNNTYEFDLVSSDYLGFVFPVYYYSIPSVVEKFIEKAKFINHDNKKVFVFLTCGATTGSAAERCKVLLSKKGIDLEYMFAIAMPDNYILLYNIDNEEKQWKMIEQSESEILRASEIIINGDKEDYITIKGPFPGIVSFFAHKAYNRLRNTKKFYALDSCINCKLCEEICPEGAIEIADGKPTWVNKKCSHCLACIHRCPVEAIQYSRKTNNRRRYKNPLVKL